MKCERCGVSIDSKTSHWYSCSGRKDAPVPSGVPERVSEVLPAVDSPVQPEGGPAGGQADGLTEEGGSQDSTPTVRASNPARAPNGAELEGYRKYQREWKRKKRAE